MRLRIIFWQRDNILIIGVCHEAGKGSLPMSKETRNLTLFFVATFAATWVTYFTIVFNSWNPYTMPGMAFLLIGGSAPSWVGVLMVLFTYTKEQRRDYF